LTFSTSSGKDRGTAYYFRNLLNCRNIKGDVKNSYRAYKMLYYTIFDGICCALFLRELNLKSFDDDIPLPPDWDKLCDSDKQHFISTIRVFYIPFYVPAVEQVSEIVSSTPVFSRTCAECQFANGLKI
jgi:hypothetical protein